MYNIVLFGPPGAGKGTQSEKLIKKYGLTHLATGDLFRKHLGEGNGLGVLAKKYMNEGRLVPDQVVLVWLRIKSMNPKIVLKAIFLMDFLGQQHRLRLWMKCWLFMDFQSLE